ncbi:hypothetical protein GNF82_13625 [Clostridium perfringens]
MFSSKIVAELNELMDFFISTWPEYSVQERIKIVYSFLERYYQLTERYPEKRLNQLSNFILMDEIANPHPDKLTREEYPILTAKQMNRRNRRTILSSDETVTDFLNVKYNSWSVEENTRVHRKVTIDKKD